jgi:hypothetical protein
VGDDLLRDDVQRPRDLRNVRLTFMPPEVARERGGGPIESADLVVQPLGRRRRRTLMVSVVVAAVGTVIGFAAHRPVTALIIGAMVALPSALMVLLAVSRKGTPLVTVTGLGLQHPTLGLVTWEEIHALRIIKEGGHRTLRIEVVDPAYMLSASARPSRLSKLNPLRGYPAIELPEAVIDLPLDDLRDEIEARAGRAWPH